MECLCSICQRAYHPRHAREFFCNSCYHTYNHDILNNAAWVQVAVNTEKQRRRNEIKDSGRVIYIGELFDVAVVNGQVRLVPTREYFES